MTWLLHTVHINKDTGQSHNFLEGSYDNYSHVFDSGSEFEHIHVRR